MGGINGRSASWAAVISNVMQKGEVDYVARNIKINRARQEINDINGNPHKGYLIESEFNYVMPAPGYDIKPLPIKTGSYFYVPRNGTIYRDSKPDIPGFQLNPSRQFIEETEVNPR